MSNLRSHLTAQKGGKKRKLCLSDTSDDDDSDDDSAFTPLNNLNGSKINGTGAANDSYIGDDGSADGAEAVVDSNIGADDDSNSLDAQLINNNNTTIEGLGNDIAIDSNSMDSNINNTGDASNSNNHDASSSSGAPPKDTISMIETRSNLPRPRRISILILIISWFVLRNNLLDETNYNNNKWIAVSTSHCNPNVVFTTFRCPNSPACTSIRQRIENNTMQIWSSMDTIEFIVMDETKDNITTNKYGVPVLSDMYLKAMSRCPESNTYTYLNGDIISNYSFVETIEAVSNTVGVTNDFLLVGKRTNVDWTMSLDATKDDFNFNAAFNNGTLFDQDAEDYFTVTKNAIDWTDIPQLVIGRPMYDSWLVQHIWLHKAAKGVNVLSVDCTDTIPAIHQTDSAGNYSWGGGTSKGKEDTWYNQNLINQWTWKFPGVKAFCIPICTLWKTAYYDTGRNKNITVQCTKPDQCGKLYEIPQLEK